MPRRARQLIPAGVPRRGELVAAGLVLIVLAHLLLAQLTIVLALAFAAVGKGTRWRLYWLLTPAVAGLAWMLAAGPGETLAGFAAGPSSVLGHLAGAHAAWHVVRPLAAFAGIGGWLPRQFPVALPLAAAEAGLIGWLDWLHTDEWAVPPPRPGAVAALRAARATRRIRSGAVLTRDGLALGITPSTGAVTGLTWQEISRGVLVAGADAREVTLTCLQLVHAAVRRRKPVIVLDDGHDAGIAHALAATCVATGTPLCRDGDDDGSGAGRAVASGAVASHRAASRGRAGASQLWGRAPGPGAGPGDVGPGDAGPGDAGPGYAGPGYAGREGQVREPSGPGLDLSRVVSERSAALVPVESPESAALAASRLTALSATLRRIGVDGDGLIWVPSAERLPAAVLAALVSDGADAGLPVLVGAVSPAAAGQLAGLVGALLMHRLTDRDLADGLAARAGTRLLPVAVAAARAGQPFPAPAGQPAGQQASLTPCPVIGSRALLSLRPAEFVLVALVPRRRVVALSRVVPARLPRRKELSRKDQSRGKEWPRHREPQGGRA